MTSGLPGEERVEVPGGRHEAPGVLCGRRRQQLPRGRELDLPTVPEDEHAVGDLGHDREVVTDEDERHPPLGDLPLQQVEHSGLHRHVERRRRLIGDEEGGVAGEGDRDRDALALTAGDLVDVRPRDLLRVQEGDVGEGIEDRSAQPVSAEPPVTAERPRDLRPDPHEGVEGGERLLEHRADDAASDGVHPPGTRGHGIHRSVGGVQDDLAPRRKGVREEAEDRQRRQRLPGPRFSDDAEALSGGHIERHVRHEVAQLRFGERDPEVADLQQRPHRMLRVVGSAMSRRPSASRFMPMIVATRRMPGRMAAVGATSTVLCASCSIRPQDAFGGGEPSPR